MPLFNAHYVTVWIKYLAQQPPNVPARQFRRSERERDFELPQGGDFRLQVFDKNVNVPAATRRNRDLELGFLQVEEKTIAF